ncbi:MAG: hypothetical protein ABI663_18650 [Chryseolinea sp.]
MRRFNDAIEPDTKLAQLDLHILNSQLLPMMIEGNTIKLKKQNETNLKSMIGHSETVTLRKFLLEKYKLN